MINLSPSVAIKDLQDDQDQINTFKTRSKQNKIAVVSEISAKKQSILERNIMAAKTTQMSESVKTLNL